jgi:hypothetical protein
VLRNAEPVEEDETIRIAEFDAATRFLALAATASPGNGLAILDPLDREYSSE